MFSLFGTVLDRGTPDFNAFLQGTVNVVVVLSVCYGSFLLFIVHVFLYTIYNVVQYERQ